MFIEPLRKADPPIIRRGGADAFIDEVFGNLAEILSHHKIMLKALFERQREQHPLVNTLTDIVLDSALFMVYVPVLLTLTANSHTQNAIPGVL